MTTPMIEARNLTKTFGSGDKTVRAVKSINFKVDAGCVYGFLGPNGAGKTTTIKMLVGGLSITSGTAMIKGHKAGTVNANSLIGYLQEHPKFYDMTLINYLIYMGRLGGHNRSKAMKKAEELIQWLELEDAIDRNINDYSSGMKQKAGLAQALIHEPEILIMDEPAANLDPIGRASMMERIRELVDEKGITVFVSSHILPEIEHLADYVTIISNGKIILSDDIGAMKKHFAGNHYTLDTSQNRLIMKKLHEAPFVNRVWIDDEQKIQVISDKDDVLQEALPGMLHESRISIRSFKQREVSLENIFLRIVSGGDETEDGGEIHG